MQASAGLGLKPGHFDQALACRAPGLWLETHAENHMVDGGPRLRWLEAIRARHPVSLHGVGASLAAPTEPDPVHLARFATLVERIDPIRVSEHLAWSGLPGASVPDLLPFRRTGRALDRIAANVGRLQDALRRPVAIENPAHYLVLDGHEWDEVDFLHALARRTGCRLLIDVANVHVGAGNLGFDARAWLDAIDGTLVDEIHVAGHTPDPVLGDALLIDSHSAPVAEPVWALLERLLARIGPRPTLIERDADVPAFEVLLAERERAQHMLRAADHRALPMSAPPARLPSGHRADPPPSAMREAPIARVRCAARDACCAVASESTTRRSVAAPRTASSPDACADGDPDLAGHRDLLRALLAEDPTGLTDLDPGTAALAVQPGFAVYRNTSLGGCVDALLAGHPAVAAAIGDEWLRAAATAFVRERWPATPVAAGHGAGFADFLARFEPAADWPWLPGVATLDRLWGQSHAAADAPSADAGLLAALPPDVLGGTVLRPHPSARWIAFADAPVVSIWRSNRGTDPVGDAPPVALDALDWRGEAVVLARPQDRVVALPLPPAALVFLEACALGLPLAEAALRTGDADPSIDLAALLASLLRVGVLATADPLSTPSTQVSR